MSSYNLKFNKDDSVIRHIIIGLLSDLNKKVWYWTQISNDERVKIDIPFYYTISGDDNFMRDHFIFTDDEYINNFGDKEVKKAVGNYDKIPRAVVQLSSMTIDSSSLVNKAIRGKYDRLDENNTLKSFTSEFEMIPVEMSFDCSVLLDSQLNIFKLTESLIKNLYKNNNFNVDVGHLNEGTYRIASYYKLPEDYSQERPIEYSFSDKKEYKVEFNIELSSFIPSFKFETEMFAGTRMVQIQTSASPTDNSYSSNLDLSNTFPGIFVQSDDGDYVSAESLLGLSQYFSYISNEDLIGIVNASGLFEDRGNYNGSFAGFTFLDIQNSVIYIKKTGEYGHWSDALPYSA